MSANSTTAETGGTSATLQAAAWMVGSILSFSTMAIAGREVSAEFDTFETMFYRSVIGIVIVLAAATLSGRLHEIRTEKFHLHLLRNGSHFFGQNCWFYALTVLPLAQVVTVEFTSPLWVIVLSPIFLQEQLSRARIISAMLGFAGVLIVARPTPSTFDPNLLFAAGAAIGFAGSAIFTKILTRSVTITCILFWLTVTQAVFGLVCAGADGDIALPSSLSLPWITVVAIAGLLAHFCLTTALKLAPAGVVMPMDFLRLPLVAILGVLIYAEPLNPWVLAGAAFILCGNYINIRTESRRRRATPRPV